MGVLNRILRLAGILIMSSIVSVFAVQQYANTFESIPPIVLNIWRHGTATSYLVDLNRGTELRAINQAGDFLRSPNGTYWADATMTNDGLEIAVARYPNRPQVMGIYDAVNTTGQIITWSADSTGLYFVQSKDMDDKGFHDGFHVMFIHAQTGDTRILTSLETYDTPQFIFRFAEDYLVLGNQQTIIVNTVTGAYHILDVPSQNIFHYGGQNGFVFYGQRDLSDGFWRLVTLEVLRLDDFSVELVDLDQFPSPPLINTPNALAWSSDGWRVAFMLASGGVGMIDIRDLSTDVLDVSMSLQGGWSADDEWLLGIQDSPDRINSAIIAYHITTGEIKTLISGKQPDVVVYRTEWSPVDNMILLYSLHDFNAFVPDPLLPIFIYDLEADTFIFKTSIQPPQVEHIFVNWSYEWFNLRYDLDNCSPDEHDCLESQN